MNLPVLTQDEISTSIFIFLRISSMIAVMPIFGGDRTLPAGIKGGLSLLITFLLFPFVPAASGFATAGLTPLVIQMISEVFIGVIIGFVARFIFAGIQFAGELIGFKMGFSIVNVLDPTTSTQMSIISQLLNYMAVLIFLAVNAHHLFLAAMAESFVRIAPLQFSLSGRVVEALCLFSRDVFVIAVKISAPVVAVLIFTDVALGIVARTVPQINIFVVGFPLQIAVGLIFLGLTASIFVNYAMSLFSHLASQIHRLILLM